MDRFASKAAYSVHTDVMECLERLNEGNITLGIISNSDPRTIKVVENLDIVPRLIPREKWVFSKRRRRKVGGIAFPPFTVEHDLTES